MASPGKFRVLSLIGTRTLSKPSEFGSGQFIVFEGKEKDTKEKAIRLACKIARERRHDPEFTQCVISDERGFFYHPKSEKFAKSCPSPHTKP